MGDLIQRAQSILLQETNLSTDHLERALSHALVKGVDSADLFLQSFVEESWCLEDGIVKDVGYSIERGFGMRVLSGEKVGFSFSDNIDQASLNNAASVAKQIVHAGQSRTVSLEAQGQRSSSLYVPETPMTCITDNEKVELLLRADAYARKKDPRIKRVFLRMESSFDSVMVLDSDGVLAADLRPLVHMSVQVIAEDGGRSEKGRAGGGARDNLLFFLNDDMAMRYVDKAVDQALLNLDAKPVPAGVMPVVLGPGWPAVLLHEAVGHGLEADFNRKRTSVFTDQIGQKVASPLCTIVDDATISCARGSLNVDDEGAPGQNTVLIEKGILKGYMTDKLNARLLNMPQTGNGRRESYSSPPLPRMTSTYMLPGESEPDEIIASVEKGLYAVDFVGGQVDITSGKFVFSMSEAYLIENGKVTTPIKGATLVGNGIEVLAQVSMVGNDLALDPGIGHCGKDGQSVPVGVGQPTLKLDAITVGGTEL